ncbi:Mth938-like domain-containing protein [Pararhodospirillum oryzae]|uniref:Mth938-like domain-containing protein n=1 Tax=Pararhodospirillum oryzae TaxID=478448 RepID=A0A512H6N2_9PROT|nr:Mth938-like domain-containing protein [Pararhodospirillum oryzae]GEO81102.1 hypothetical protein ROR02_12330 [Pararhodospirillum oryzae]
MDLTLQAAPGRQVVQAYGEGGFRVSGVAWTGSLLVFPGETLAWPGTTPTTLDEAALAQVRERASHLDLLLVGTGPSLVFPPASVRAALKDMGLAMETMDTGAACRTYNVLIHEDRRVAAALVAV